MVLSPSASAVATAAAIGVAAYVLHKAKDRDSPPATGPDRLRAAAELVRDAGPGLKGLSTVLHSLATQTHWPDDITEWLCARLRAARVPHTCEYTDPVLDGSIVMKCDEFDGIHMLKEPRPHPHAWNFRKTTAALPVYGAGQCHLEGLLHIARLLKAEGYDEVRWFNMREEPVVFLNGHACAPRVPDALNENGKLRHGAQTPTAARCRLVCPVALLAGAAD